MADEVGTLKLDKVSKNLISAGDVGYLITGIKNAKEVKVGDTIIEDGKIKVMPLRDLKSKTNGVCRNLPVDTDDYEELRKSMEKLQLNDASLVFIPESSAALGFGFRCGFLGMLHLEIIQQS